MGGKRKKLRKRELDRLREQWAARARKVRHCRRSQRSSQSNRSTHNDLFVYRKQKDNRYYCHCGGKKEGEIMVECSGKSCYNRNWLHVSCAGINESMVPQLPVKWYCDNCKKQEKDIAAAFERRPCIGEDPKRSDDSKTELEGLYQELSGIERQELHEYLQYVKDNKEPSLDERDDIRDSEYDIELAAADQNHRQLQLYTLTAVLESNLIETDDEAADEIHFRDPQLRLSSATPDPKSVKKTKAAYTGKSTRNQRRR